MDQPLRPRRPGPCRIRAAAGQSAETLLWRRPEGEGRRCPAAMQQSEQEPAEPRGPQSQSAAARAPAACAATAAAGGRRPRRPLRVVRDGSGGAGLFPLRCSLDGPVASRQLEDRSRCLPRSLRPAARAFLLARTASMPPLSPPLPGLLTALAGTAPLLARRAPSTASCHLTSMLAAPAGPRSFDRPDCGAAAAGLLLARSLARHLSLLSLPLPHLVPLSLRSCLSLSPSRPYPSIGRVEPPLTGDLSQPGSAAPSAAA